MMKSFYRFFGIVGAVAFIISVMVFIGAEANVGFIKTAMENNSIENDMMLLYFAMFMSGSGMLVSANGLREIKRKEEDEHLNGDDTGNMLTLGNHNYFNNITQQK